MVKKVVWECVDQLLRDIILNNLPSQTTYEVNRIYSVSLCLVALFEDDEETTRGIGGRVRTEPKPPAKPRAKREKAPIKEVRKSRFPPRMDRSSRV